MQFLAFLNDSYREARNGWMLQVMLFLAGIMILLVASISYRPVTIDEELSDRLRFMTSMMAMNPRFDEQGHPTSSVANVQVSNPSEPWKSDCQFDFVISCPTPADLIKFQKSGLPMTRSNIRHFMVEMFGKKYQTVKVEGDSADSPVIADPADAGTLPGSSEARYHVSLIGCKVEDGLAWTHRMKVFFAWEVPLFDQSLRETVYKIEKYLVNTIGGWLLIFIGIVVTAGFIPNMLAKGSLDLLISKPIGRSRLFVYKYVGGLLFVLVLTSVSVLGFWVVIGLRSGVWATNFLATIPILTFYFAILYAVSATTAMFTRNSLVAILMTILAWGIFWGVGKINEGIESRREQEIATQEGKNKPLQVPNGSDPDQLDHTMAQIDPNAPLWGVIPKSTFFAFTGLQVISPRNYQIDDRLSRVIAEGVLTPSELKERDYDKAPRESWLELIGVSIAFIIFCLGISCWRFETRDL